MKIKTSVCFWVLAFLSSVPWPTALARPNDVPTTPVKISWFTSDHQSYDPHWATRLLWRWVGDGGQENTERRPVLRLWIAIPTRLELKKINTDPTTPIKAVGLTQDYPELIPYEAQIVALDILDLFSTASVSFEMRDLARKLDYKLSLQLELEGGEPNQVIDPICEEMGISLTKRRGEGKFFFVANRCEDSYDTITLDVLTSSDAQVGNHTFTSKNIELPDNAHRFILRKPEYVDGPTSVGSYSVLGALGEQRATYVTYWYPHVVPPNFRFGAGLGTTYLTYSESFTRMALQEVALTGKIQASYTVIPRLLALDASAYTTLLPLFAATQPQVLGAARFYGINGRFGYELPVNFNTTHWRFLVGWYLFGMTSDNNNYGIGTMAGPQLFIATRTQQIGHREWSAYFKYALIGQGQFSSASYEVAVGGSYQVSSPFKSRPWMITLDASHVAVPILILPSELSLYTLSLGVSTTL